MEKIKTVCSRNCPDTCFIDLTMEKGQILKTRGCTDNPVTQGFICPRGNRDSKRVYSQKRVLYPFVKPDEQGSEDFLQVSWNDALSKVSEVISKTIANHGNGALLLYDYPGNQGFLSWQFPRRLWMALGATTTDYSLCSSSGHAGIGLHYGLTYGIQPEKLLESKIIIFWGNNAKVSSPHQWALANKARKNNAAIIISIDPRKSETSQASDIWIQPRPGSDVALSYGLARYLIQNNGVDKKFLDEWATGYQEYSEEALSWTPDRVEKVACVSMDLIKKVGDLFIQSAGPAAFMIGLGLQKSLQGAQAARAVSLLPALMGHHRGFHYSDSNGRNVDWDYINGASQTLKKGRVVNQVSIGERLARGEFKFIFVLGSNPAITLPDQSVVRQGLKRKDVFVVVQDTHWSETASLADVVLPAPTYLEKTDIVFSDHHLYSRLSQRAIEPLKESRHEIWVMQELAKKIKKTEAWLFEDPWQALDKAFKDTYKNGHLKDILEGEVLEIGLKPLNRYQTPSEKIEFSASTAPDIGVSRLPFQEELQSDKQTFVLLNSAIPKYTHSQFTDVYGPIPEIVWINPIDAEKLGIQDGKTVEVFNDFGNVVLKAKVTDKISIGTFWAPRPLTGLNGEPLNSLAPGITQKIGGGPIFNSIKVRIKQKID
jgi:anaerobic selenocysteine-containing dehydrogenase